MRWFRRRYGRHALGAAVTGIPSGPLRPLAVPLVAAARPLAPPESGRATAPVTATPPAPARGGASRAVDEQAASARSSIAAALAQLLPQESAPEAPVPEPSPKRVQLGFRDGTSTELDPGSDHSMALARLAQSLTRRH